MPTQPLPPKKEVALALLERTSVFVHLDPRVDAVVVPVGFKKQAQLVLQVGLNMPVPIRDLHLDDEGMTCTLSFNRTPFFCIVPWSSVYAVVGCDDGRGMIWPDDVPPEIAQAQARAVETARVGRLERVAPKAVAGNPERQPAQAEGGKAKRSRKRPASGGLGAVPNPASSPEVAPRSQRNGQGSPASAPERPAAAASPLRPAARVGETTGRRKRELPPYLRVVK
ncbi:MAG: ClpXP protease specificity-enhancing factor SspB [Polyangiaceae bacterium]